MYNPESLKAEEFISHEEILSTLEYAEANKNNIALIDEILDKAKLRQGLSQRGNLCAGRTDKKRLLRQQDCFVCAAVSFQLLRQRLRLLSVSCQKQTYCPQKNDAGGSAPRSDRPAGHGA